MVVVLNHYVLGWLVTHDAGLSNEGVKITLAAIQRDASWAPKIPGLATYLGLLCERETARLLFGLFLSHTVLPTNTASCLILTVTTDCLVFILKRWNPRLREIKSVAQGCTARK